MHVTASFIMLVCCFFQLLRDVSFEDYILRCFDFDCPPDSIVERTGLYHCLETESYWMETKSGKFYFLV